MPGKDVTTMNKVILMGRLTKNPEIKYAGKDNDMVVARYTLAVNRNRRKELGMTQDELAYQIGIGRQALSAIENGGTFKTSTLDKLVEVLDVTETFIMRGDIDDIKDGLIKEVASVMADMDEIQIRQFIAMMKAAKEVV